MATPRRINQQKPWAGAPILTRYACTHTCPGGRKCCLDGGIGHTLHICGTPGCSCHSRARYEGTLVQDGAHG